jgi:hypothetical protein
MGRGAAGSFARTTRAGSVCLFTSARTHVVVDVNGWFA